MENLLGVVLCGGQSKRMGTDKGLLKREGKAWAVCIAEKLREAKLEVVVSINEKQKPGYQDLFRDTCLLIDHVPIEGPLGGLLSVHTRFPEKDILLMACDLIDMEQNTITMLIKKYTETPSYEYYVYRQHGFTQPFCAIYSAEGLAKVYTSFENKGLKKYSLHDRFEEGHTFYISIENDTSFNNYNQLPHHS